MLIWLDEITQKEEKYNNNIQKISIIEKENERLMAEMCCNIKNSQDNILEEIKKNQDYLKFLPEISPILEMVQDALSNDTIDVSSAKLTLEILHEIQKHNLENQDNLSNKNINKSAIEGIIDKFSVLVRGKEDNDN